MTVVHVVLFKWKGGVKPEDIEGAFEEISALEKKCKGLEGIMWGENSSEFSEGFTHVLVVLAKNKASLEGYRKHPLHKSIDKDIGKMQERIMSVDFEA
ncbi:MAG TPA: Dabb family protein [archaeon]|nr:Dabb family protein [archaeon]